jgi:hypothetical protein
MTSGRDAISKIASAGKVCNIQLSISDKSVMFYGYKVANFFGFTKPTRVLMDYSIEMNIFSMVVVEDIESQGSCTGPQKNNISSSDDEDENQQAIEVRKHYVIRYITYSGNCNLRNPPF